MTLNFDGPPLDVVAVGAHPDDVEMGCGGTLALLVKQGYRVGIVDLTDGEPTPRCPSPEVRLEEARRAAETLGVHQRITLDLPNRRLFDTYEARVALAKVLRTWRPEVVIGFGHKTPMASPDHWQAMQITDAAVFYARLTKWPDVFDDLPEHLISTQLYFKLDLEPWEFSPAMTHFVVDISETIDQKMASIHCYRTQFPPAKAAFVERIRSIAEHMGAKAHCSAGEMFAATRTVGIRDLMQLLRGR